MNNTRTRIKICGITTPNDARMVAKSGVDAIGMVFYDKSPRAVSIENALNITKDLPVFVSSVGLFVNADVSEVERVLHSVPLDILQFHGEETEEYCKRFSRPYIKALKVKPGMDIVAMINQFPSAMSVLLDAWHPSLDGGTGLRFDWSLLACLSLQQRQQIILAGGLDSSNVGSAITKVAPYAVDVSSGVEETPGKKSFEKVSLFVKEVMSV